MQLIAPASAGDAAALSLAAAALAWQDAPDRLDPALTAWRLALTNGYYQIPFMLVLDLTGLVTEAHGVQFHSERPGSADSEGPERLRYEREIIGRLLQTPCVMEAVDLVKPGAGSPAARLHLISLLLDRLAPFWPRHAGINPGSVRDLTAAGLTDADPLTAAGRFAAAHPGLPSLAESLNAFVTAATAGLQWSRLLESEDYFELTHLTHLPTAHLRIGCRQVIALCRQLGAARLPAFDLRRHDAESETAFIDETTYPTGGFSGLTNHGSFENLLTSELAYMDPTPAGVSLFDLRFVEGELLFYLRDEGTMRRRRRTIHFIIDAGDLFGFQAPGCDCQYAILAQALCLRLKEDLTAVFELDALRFHFHLLPPEPPEILEAEAGILRVLLADDTAHDRARLLLPQSLALADLVDPHRKTYAVVLARHDRAEAWRTMAAPLLHEGLLHCSVLPLGDAVRLDSAALSAERAALAGRLVDSCDHR